MTRSDSASRSALVVLVGLALVALGLSLALGPGAGHRATPGVISALVFTGLCALAGALWKIRGTLDDTSSAPVPWADDGGFATPAPERTSVVYPLSSDSFGAVIETAGSVAREEGTVTDGLSVVRPPLRDVLTSALVTAGHSPDAVREALESGSWTDDPVAASVLESSVSPPETSIRERVVAWLFPERVVHERTRRAMQAVAEAADEALPTVPGQTAPRPVPIVQPRLEDLQRDATGTLQRAVDPHAVVRGPGPRPYRVRAERTLETTDQHRAESERDRPDSDSSSRVRNDRTEVSDP